MANQEEQSSFRREARATIVPSQKSRAQEVLNTLILRSGLVFEVNELNSSNMRGRAAISKSYKQVVLAAISSDIAIYDPSKKAKKRTSPRPDDRLETADLTTRAYRDDCELCEAAKGYDRSAWEAARVSELKTALAPPRGFDQPHVICYGELAYPPPPASDFVSSVDYVSQFGRLQAQFENQLRAVCDNHGGGQDPFLFLGSYHCPITLYNVGMVMPRGPRAGRMKMKVTVVTLRKNGDKPKLKRGNEEISLPIPHRKRFPAKRVSEKTRVPPDNQFRVFATPIGRVAILICSDVVDMNQFLFVAHYNDARGKVGRIDYVLVPSYNTSPHLVEMCRQLSEIAATTVLAVNAHADDDGREFPVTAIHCCGVTVSSAPVQAETEKGPLGFVTVRSQTINHGPGRGIIDRKSRVTWFRFDTRAFVNFVNERADATKTELGLATKWELRAESA